jgi:dihydroorotate dehydrogenase (NAD+) catalytic subunit
LTPVTDARPEGGETVSSEPHKVDLGVTLGGLALTNPVMAASGTFGYGTEYEGVLPPERLGAVVTKAITVGPRDGNPPPRLWETDAGLINSIGLANCGLQVFLKDKLPALRARGARVVVNVAGTEAREFAEVAAALDKAEGVHALELNLSCPNVAAGGMALGVDPSPARGVVRAVRATTDKPLLVKLPPHTHLLVEVAEAVRDAGADALTLVNTLPAMAVDVATGLPRLGAVTGGLSGPALRPVALAVVWKVHRSLEIPIVGVGGILEPCHAIEFLLCGAMAVQVGTGLFRDPLLPLRILEALGAYCADRGISSVRDIVGTLKAD